MSERGRVGPVAWALGFAGLLPQMAAAGVLLALRGGTRELVWPVVVFAVCYPAVILSFIGGIWWGAAMRRDVGQGPLVVLAVLPSLGAAAFLVLSTFGIAPGWVLVANGSAIIATLLVERRLVSSGDAPEGWMRLRVPLSIGLGALTLLVGAVAS